MSAIIPTIIVRARGGGGGGEPGNEARIAVRCTCDARRSASRLSRPGAGYPRSEGSGAKFEVYLGIAIAARALRADLEDIDATPSPLSPSLCGVPCSS